MNATTEQHDAEASGPASCANVPTRAFFRANGAEAYILALARSFPCLAHKLESWTVWNAVSFERASRPWSHGERVCADFVLTVWNYADAKRARRLFDFCDAVGTLGYRELTPILIWMRDPVWP